MRSPDRHFRRIAGVLLLTASMIGWTTGLAQTPDPAAASGFDAAAEYQTLSMSEDVAAEDWFALAQRARAAGDFATAARALDIAATTLSPVRVGLERSRIATLAGDTGVAVEQLDSLYRNGFQGIRLITGDPVLATLAGSREYDVLIEEMSKSAFPCLHDDRFREFDFWVGNWDVHQANGQFAGSNSIRREESGCVLTEHWEGAGGGSGSSINYLDHATGEWVQVWNSENGTQISIRGGLTGKGMLLEGQIHSVATGVTAPFRGLWTLLDDGRVRQFFEQSNDDGETWTPWFEGYYTRSTGATNE